MGPRQCLNRFPLPQEHHSFRFAENGTRRPVALAYPDAEGGSKKKTDMIALLASLARLLVLSTNSLGAAGAGADYAREERLAQEIVPAIVVGDAIYLETPAHRRVLALYTAVAWAKGGVIVVHGAGVHPDWGLDGALRTGLADLGFATLSVQMPVLAADAPRDGYPALFPEAGNRVGAAIAFLRERGIRSLAIVSHSTGASMVDAYLARGDAAHIDAWVIVGMPVDFAMLPKEPVLDVIAGNDFPDVRAAARKRRSRLPNDGCSRALVLDGTDHLMENRQQALVVAVAPFLERALAGACK